MPTEQYTTYISQQMAEIERQKQLAAKYQKKVRYVPPKSKDDGPLMLFFGFVIVVGVFVLWAILPIIF